MNIVLLAAWVAAAFVLVALVSAIWRMLTGPAVADRVIATDMLGMVGICVAALAALITGQPAYFYVGFGIALLGFLAAVALAGLVERTTRPSKGGRR